jgi:hypothetical protein
MEPRFGYDFSQVRTHTDAKAAQSARAVNALAYTVGQEMVFASGQYEPQTVEGKRLIAHELAHTIQQTGGARLQRAEEPDASAEMLDEAITIVQQSLDGALARATGEENQPATEADIEAVEHLQTALDNLSSLKASGNPEEILPVVQPILAAANGKSPENNQSQGLQRKMIIGAAHDSLEQEADNIARRVSQGETAGELSPGRAHQAAPAVQRQVWEEALVGGAVSAGPVGWAILAAVVVGAGIYLATRPRTTTTTVDRTRPRFRPGRRGDCDEMLTACLLTSLADLPGNVYGSGRCVMCADVCISQDGVWPTSAPTVSGGMARCDFWNSPGRTP